MKPIENVDKLRSYFQHRWPDDWPIEEVNGRKIALVAKLMNEAIQWLEPVLSKVSRNASDDNKAAFANKGISTKWTKDDLAIAGKAYSFCCAARDVDLTPSQRSAVELLNNCAFAIETNALPEELMNRILSAYEGLHLDAINTGDAVIAGGIKGGIIRGEQQSREKAEKDEVEVIHGRGKVSAIIKELALRTDQLGDYLSPKDELWTELIGRLDELGLRPREVCDESGNPLRIDYRDGDGKTGVIKFSSFKAMVSTARKVK